MPRAKSSKQYKRLMNQYGELAFRGVRSKNSDALLIAFHVEINFGFREPYQVLSDSQFLEAAIRSKMDIDHILKATLHGNTKLRTSCCVSTSRVTS